MDASRTRTATRRSTRAGILIVHKPSGLTSRAVVDRVVRLVSRVKVGHAGTLDPLASGVLIICIGQATRLVEMVHQMSKSYRTTIFLGARSDTLDADGRITMGSAMRIRQRRRRSGWCSRRSWGTFIRLRLLFQR